MKKLTMVAGLITLISVPAFGAPQDYSLDPNPAMSASSNDRSRDPAGVTTGSYYEGLRAQHYRNARAHYRGHRYRHYHRHTW